MSAMTAARTEVTERGHQRMIEQRIELQARLATAEAEVLEAQNGSGDSEGLMAVEAIDSFKALQVELARLERELAKVVVVSGGNDTVSAGSTVVLDFGDGDGEEYCFGSLAEAGDGVSVLTPDSPIGRAVAGMRSGDTVGVDAPNGSYQVRIISVS